jgi:hypothetical protein
MISKKVIPNKSSTIIFENSKFPLDAIVLSISNSDVTKPFSISGSNDQKEWFGLINNAKLDYLEDDQSTSVFKTVTLPLSSYRYLKISLDDRKTLPINILKIGRYKNTTQSDSLLEIAPESYQTTELLSQKISRIHVIFNPLQIVNQVSFTITNPNLFKRKARIYVMKSEEIKHKKKTFEETIVRFELNSETQNSFKIPQLFQKDFYIEIENRDNPPLTLAGIHFFQQQLAVIAYLNANENYTLKTGNPKWLTPEYDLENFKNTIPDHLAQVKITEIEHQEINKKNPENKSIWQQAWFMWLCIGIGGLAIVYFTLSLVKDMNKN